MVLTPRIILEDLSQSLRYELLQHGADLCFLLGTGFCSSVSGTLTAQSYSLQLHVMVGESDSQEIKNIFDLSACFSHSLLIPPPFAVY